MLKLLTVLTLSLISTYFLSACLPQINSENPPASTNMSEDKSGYTELTGIILQQGTTFILQANGKNFSVESYSVNLAEYTGQTITVKGKYSGDTLFIEEILP